MITLDVHCRSCADWDQRGRNRTGLDMFHFLAMKPAGVVGVWRGACSDQRSYDDHAMWRIMPIASFACSTAAEAILDGGMAMNGRKVDHDARWAASGTIRYPAADRIMQFRGHRRPPLEIL